MIEFRKTDLDGVRLLVPRIFSDDRGTFVKTFHKQVFADAGTPFQPAEEFFSTSHKGVVRGMHFQLPPAAHDKLVYCATGAVLDVVLDIRRASPTFGRAVSFELSATNRHMLFIPIGFAHGFMALEDATTMVYQTSTVHSLAHDAGILWNSIGFNWPVKEPIMSARDKAFPKLADFASPF